MKLLLTSAGVSNASIREALVGLLGKPIEESAALVVATAIHPFAGGPGMAARLVRGEVPTPMTDLGWASLGLLEPTALPSIDRDVWLPGVESADALLVWGGDPVYLSYWLRESGLAEVLPSLDGLVYVGTSAGAMATAATFGETYTERPAHSAPVLTSEEIVLGGVRRTLVTATGAGFVDFALIPHLVNPDHAAASMADAQTWAAKLAVPTYAIDDATALSVVDGTVEVVSEGVWRHFASA